MQSGYGDLHIYGMRLRGFSPGAQPKQGLITMIPAYEKIKLDPRNEYWDLIGYDRELTEEEMERFSLDIITP